MDTFTTDRKGYNATYVNVDTSTTSGLYHADKLKFLQSKIADVISIASVYDSTRILYTSEYPGRMFALFTHPIERSVAYYNCIKKATWDERYNPDITQMTLAQFSASKHIENNPMVRLFTQAPGIDLHRKLTNIDLEVAKKILERKCLVGLYRDMNDSLARFDRYFGWTRNSVEIADEENFEKKMMDVKKCCSRLEAKGDWWMSKQKSEIDQGSFQYNMIVKANELDMKLYSRIEVRSDL